MRKFVLSLVGAVVMALGMASSASAGNLFITGHDSDLHCAFGQQCNAFGLAVDFARTGTPTPSLPILVLNNGGGDVAAALGQAAARARNTVEGAGNAFNFVVVDPSSAAFGTLSLSTSSYSAIVIASDITCGGCDLNTGVGSTPDSDAINARTADIQNFFNAGGGLVYLSGAENRGVYYASLPLPAAAVAVAPPFTRTPEGIAFGLTDSDANCCATHNSFSIPPPGSALIVLETDSSGNAETMIARGAAVGGGGIITPPPSGEIPEPASMILLGTGLAGLGAAVRRRRQARKTEE